jgi:excisionase family DNA binding protein
MKAGSSTPPPARLLTDEQAADYLGVSRSYVRALLARGALKTIELPSANGTEPRARLVRLDVRDLDTWLDALPRG